ncbi:hypothetical protein MMC30_008410 [Trapelia coarctata]|nr:hypothetical protein [Trapelia coarctata]
MLCKACQKIFLEGGPTRRSEDPDKGFFDHHTSNKRLRRAIERGCPLCRRAWHSQFRDAPVLGPLSDVKATRYTIATITNDNVPDFKAFNRLIFEFELADPDTEGKGTWWAQGAEFDFQAQLELPGMYSIRVTVVETGVVTDLSALFSKEDGDEVGESTSSEHCFRLAEYWIENCNRTHTKCKTGRIEQRDRHYASRFLDLEAETPSRIRVCETDSLELDVTYAVLSHCWGRCEKLTLLKENVEDLKREIEFDGLPKTFRDAVQIARRLRIRYLWIDSLCIIQDSAEDWLGQAAVMGAIYKYSCLSIGAASARDDDGGCFYDRDGDVVRPLYLKILGEPTKRVSKTSSLSRRLFYFNISTHKDDPDDAYHEELEYSRWLSPGTYLITDCLAWFTGVTTAPLYSRAWTVQERLLAPRILHYGSEQLFWECEELDACEAYPQGSPQKSLFLQPFKQSSPYDLALLPFEQMDFRARIDREDKKSTHVLDAWDVIVMAYAQGNLTRPEDKLVAIAGIVEELRPLMQCEFHAGLWGRYLERQLAWWAGMLRSRPLIYRGPSWSWVSVQSLVVNAFDLDDSNQLYKTYTVEVLDIQVTKAEESNSSLVTDGFLCLNGRLFEAEILPFDKHERCDFDVGGSILKAAFMDHKDIDFTVKYHCLPIAIWIGDRGVVQAHGMILQAVDGAAGVFTRQGHFRPEESGICDFSCFLNGTDDVWQRFSETHGAGAGPYGNQTIRII